jgi:hypothetical protein
MCIPYILGYQCWEVSLRDAMDQALCQDKENGYWFDLPYVGSQPVKKAKRKIASQNKDITPGRIIAELNFGYWTRLFSTRYETKQIIWPRLIRPIFPDLPKALCVREILSKRIQDLRKLRNRVYHYEPIWDLDLNQYFIRIRCGNSHLNDYSIAILAKADIVLRQSRSVISPTVSLGNDSFIIYASGTLKMFCQRLQSLPNQDKPC